MEKKDLDMQSDNSLFLAIYMITYNHGAFIEETIESLMNQNTSFKYKLFIGEDLSSDNTRAICLKLKEKYPNKIDLFLNTQNLGPNLNAKQIFKACFESGAKYIALCEGDDYWTDKLKLQKQVDFLEANPDYVICYHKVKVLRNGILEEDSITRKAPETTTIKDLAKGNYLHTCSVVFRNKLFEKFPSYFHKSPIGDYFLHMLNARYGKIKFIDEYMGVYRLHETSVWSSKTQVKREQIWLKFLKNIRKNFDKEVQNILDDQIKQYKIVRNKRRVARLKKVIKRFLFLKEIKK
ncbi:glycosyltransferase [Flavobacterium johnsoniae]|uniref:glycosyltransferase n=1 Tax=Flavobacterium johnsoniae TaxID=986 RepID=UPI00165A07C8|nr:glycosyltransferase [Flavobacterium johnsoniae]